MKSQMLVVVLALSLICNSIAVRALPQHSLSFLLSEGSQMEQEINNSLDYMMKNNQTYLSNPEQLSLWVASKAFLGRSVNATEAFDYFNSRQESDGAWSGTQTRMFTTHRVLLAYYLLNATPAQSLDAFFSDYDTWAEARNYMLLHDSRNMYHVIFAWVSYYWSYPPWINDFFNEVETDLSWTNSWDFHKRTHILYSYVIARRPFPNLDGIINATLDEQMPDGHWEMSSPSSRPVYSTSIQISLLNQILKLYPNYRESEIMVSLEKAKVWVNSTYRTVVLDEQVCGYFGDALSLEDAIFTGILSAGQTGLMPANIDMTYQDLYSKITGTCYIFIVPFYGSDYTITIVCNSSLTNFDFNSFLKQISFNVTGSATTIGYCHVSIPKAFMWSDLLSQWSVTIDSTLIDTTQVTENSTYTFLTFTFILSTRQIAIQATNVIPEFPSIAVLVITLVITSFVVVLSKNMTIERKSKSSYKIRKKYFS